MADIKPLDKTLVTSITQTLADTVTRSRLGAMEAATKISRSSPFVMSDIDISFDNPYVIPSFDSILTVMGYGTFRILVTNEETGDVAAFSVNRLFILHGKSDARLTIDREPDMPALRCSVIYS